MKKLILNILKIFLGILAILILTAAIAYFYLNAKGLNFEGEYEEKGAEIRELSIDEIRFLDRNRNQKLDVYEDARESLERRAEDLLSQMTLEEKIHLLKGSGMKSALGQATGGVPGAVGTVVPTPRLGIPELYLSDGPAGLRISATRKNESRTYYATAFPIGSLLASTWNTDLIHEVGKAMGNEALSYGIDVILGPGANIHRNPLCGRNFEYYSEDPILSGNISAAMINGIESNGVGTAPKHFVVNNQETARNYNNAIVSERALREIYLKGFEIIVKKSQPWSVMSSYNKVNGEYVPESRRLLSDILRTEWGFEGVVMTDWFGGEDATASINAGNDLLEPGTKNQWDALKKSAKEGDLPQKNIDASAKRILKLILGSKKMEDYAFDNNPKLEEHAKITRNSASEGMVLLKNENMLPFKEVKNIALIGSTSYNFISGGTGSGDVDEAYTVALDEALKNAGYELNKDALQAYEEHQAKNTYKKPQGTIEVLKAMMNPYSPENFDYSTKLLKKVAKTSDIAVITIGRNSGEGFDRVEKDDFKMTDQEIQMIQNTCKEFHALNKKVLVVLNVGGVVETASWKNHPDAILLAWQGGQEGGNSVVDILDGKINPSGKLPMTFPIHLSDHKSSENFPMDGEKMNILSLFFSEEKSEDEFVKNKDYTLYEEGIYVGYRHFDKENLGVSFPFGYGLSYTAFEYSDLKTTERMDTLRINLKVKNTGTVNGKEIIQVYASKPETEIDRPVRELKAFVKTILLEPGETAEVRFNIPSSDLSYWDETINGWNLENGSYAIEVGASSRDIRLSQEIDLKNKSL